MHGLRRAPASLVVGVAAMLFGVIVGDVLARVAAGPFDRPVPALAWTMVYINLQTLRFAALALVGHGAWRLATRSRGVERTAAIVSAIACALLLMRWPVEAIAARTLEPERYLRFVQLEPWALFPLISIAALGRIGAIVRRAPIGPLVAAALAHALRTTLVLDASRALDDHAVLGTALSVIELGAFGWALAHARLDALELDPPRAARGFAAIEGAFAAQIAIITIAAAATVGLILDWPRAEDVLVFVLPGAQILAAIVLVTGALAASDAGLDRRASWALAAAALAMIAMGLYVADELFIRESGLRAAAYMSAQATTIAWSQPLWLVASVLAIAASIRGVSREAANPWPAAVILAIATIGGTWWSLHDPAETAVGWIVRIAIIDGSALAPTVALALVVRRIASHLGGMPSLPTAVVRS